MNADPVALFADQTSLVLDGATNVAPPQAHLHTLAQIHIGEQNHAEIYLLNFIILFCNTNSHVQYTYDIQCRPKGQVKKLIIRLDVKSFSKVSNKLG